MKKMYTTSPKFWRLRQAFRRLLSVVPLLLTLSALVVKAQNAPPGCDKYKMLVSEFTDNFTNSFVQVIDLPPPGSGMPSMCNLGSGSGNDGLVIDYDKNIAYSVSGASVKIYNFATASFTNTYPIPGMGNIYDATLSLDKTKLYLGSQNGLVELDVSSGNVTLTRPNGNFPGEGTVWGVAVQPGTGNLYVARGYNADGSPTGPPGTTISYLPANNISGGTPILVSSVSNGSSYIGIVFDNFGDGTLWAILSKNRDVPADQDKLVHLAANGTVLGTFNMPPSTTNPFGGSNNAPFDIAIGPNGIVYFTSFYGPCVTAFDPGSNSFSTYIPYVPNVVGKGIAFVCGNFKCPDCQVTFSTATTQEETCNNASVPNNDATITVSGISNIGLSGAKKANIKEGSSYGSSPSFTDASSVSVSGEAVTFNDLKHNTVYTVRLWNGSDGCFTDVTITSATITCIPTACSLTVTVSPTNCMTATNSYNISGNITLTNNTAGGTATVTDGSVATTVPVAASATSVAYSLTGLSSDGESHTVIITLADCASAVATYTAPEACTVAAPVLALEVGIPVCNTATNVYTVAGTVSFTNASAGTVTITDEGVLAATISIMAGESSVPFTLTGISGSEPPTRSVLATFGSTTSNTTYDVPASCSVVVSPVCSISVVTTVGICQTATNTYSVTGIVSAANAEAQTLLITDGTQSTTVAIGGAITSATYALTGLLSGTGSHTLTVVSSGIACAPVEVTYIAPESCTVCLLSLTTAMLANGQVGTAYSQTLTTAGGTAPYIFAIAGGSLPAGLSLDETNGVISGIPLSATTASFTVSVSDGTTCSAVAPLTITTAAEPVCSLTATVTPTDCNTATNQYTVTGTVSSTNSVATQSLTISVGSVSTTVDLTGDGPVDYTLVGLTSDGAIKTITVTSSASACGMTSVTYAAPVACTLAVTAGLGDYVFADNNGNGIQDGGDVAIPGVTVILYINGVASATTTTDGSGLYSFTGLTPGSSISYAVGFGTPVGYSATTPLSGTDKALDSDAVNGLTASVTLASGENNLTLDAGFVLLPVAGLTVSSATVCVGATASLLATGCTGNVTWSAAAGAPGTSPSTGALVTVATVSLSGITSQTVLSYTATCTVGSSVTSAVATVTVNPQPNLTITASPDEIVMAGSSVTLTATGCAGGSVNWSTGQEDVASVVVMAGSAGGSSETYSATCITPSGCSDTESIEITTVAATCNLALTAVPGDCDPATNLYALTGSVSAMGSVGVSSVTVSSGSVRVVVSLSGNGPVSYTLSGLVSNGSAGVVSVVSSATECGSGSTTYTAPVSCSTAPPGQPTFDIVKVVNTTRARLGDVLSYTVTLVNTGTASGSVVATDVLDSKLSYVPNSASVSEGTYNSAAGTWTITSLAASATATLSFSASVLAEGIVYNTASIDSKTVSVCTSIPVRVCAGSEYAFSLSVATGSSRYQWYKDDVLIQDNGAGVTGPAAYTGLTPNELLVTTMGAYRIVVNEGVSGQCPDLSCCPFIVEEVSLPTGLTLTAVAPTCVGTTPQANGKIVVTGLGSSTANTGLTYQYSTGGMSFSAATAQPVPADGVPGNGQIVSDAVGGITYFVRVFGPALADGESCFVDLTVVVPVANCACPAEVCMPVSIRKTKLRSGVTGQ